MLVLTACDPTDDGEGTASAAPGPASRAHEIVVPGTTVRHSTDIPAAELELTVGALEVLESCPGRGVQVQPTLGQFVVLDVTVSLVGPDAGTSGGDAFAVVTPDVFRIAAPDGRVHEIVVTEEAWGCYEDAELLPPFVDPGETVSGKIVLESATEHGWVIYAPEAATGWKWEF